MKRVGIRDVATAAGVSVTTVSHALSGRGVVAPETRRRVEEAARTLNYAPNRIASSLRHRRTRVIGLVSDQIATTPFAGRLVLGAQVMADEHDLVLMLVDSLGDPETEVRQIEALIAYQVDGFLYAKMFHQVVERPEALVGRPAVFVDADVVAPEHCVVPDEYGIGAAATRHLIEAGHRRFATLTVPEDTPAKVGRLAGIAETLKSSKLRGAAVSLGSSTAVGGREAALRVLEGPDRPTAVVCFNDQMAMGLYQAARELDLRIPQDISVVGVDDLRIVTEALRPQLTTVALPHREMGAWAVERLVAVLDGSAPAPATHRITCRLVERASVAAPST
jgi:LacI family transcriptional regulator